MKGAPFAIVLSTVVLICLLFSVGHFCDIKVKKEDSWTRAIAALSLNSFDVGVSESKMLDLLKRLNSDKLRIIDFIKPNTVVFEKRNCDYEFIGKKFEQWLFDNFELKR